MRKLPVRSLAAASALCVTAAFSGLAPATAQTSSGVGTSTASVSVLDLKLGKTGQLLHLRLIGDDATSTIDSAVSPPHSRTRLVPLSLTSEAIPGLNALTEALPKFETRDPGGQRRVSGEAIDLANLGATLGSVTPGLPSVVPANLLGGKIVPAGLSSLLEGGVATSTLEAQLADLKLLFGALGVKSVANVMDAKAASPQTNGNRSLKVGAVSVLTLGELLQGLTMALNDLPVKTISDLVTKLKLPVDLPTGELSVASAVDTIDKAIAAVKAAVAAAPAPAAETLATVVNKVEAVKEIVLELPPVLPVSQVTDVPVNVLLGQTVNTTLTTLQATLTNLLATATKLVGDTALLKFEGAEVSALTRATDNLATSAAEVTSNIGGVTVLNTTLPGVNLAGVGELVSTVTNTIGGVLGLIDPALKDLVGVDLLKKSTSVSTSGGYIRSAASFDVLKVSITPPPGIAALAKTLTGSSASSTNVLSGAGIANPASVLPVHGASMSSLAGALNLPAGVGALLEGLTLRVGSVQSNSDHIAAASVASPAVVAPAPGPVPAPGQQLPRTGSESTQMAVMAFGLAVLALGLRRFVLRPSKG